MRRKKADAQPLMMNLCARRKRLLAAIERGVHIKLCLELLRGQIRNGMAEIEIVREMLPLAAQEFILRRSFKVGREGALCIRKCTAACAHHLRETPLFIIRNFLVGTQIQNCLDCLVNVARMNILANCAVILHPTHYAFLSNLKYAISGGHPIRRGNQLPFPVCT